MLLAEPRQWNRSLWVWEYERNKSPAEFARLVANVKHAMMAGADLTVRFFDIPGTGQSGMSPSPPLSDRPTSITILVENTGLTPVEDTFPITLRLDGSVVHTWTFVPLAEGKPSPLLPGGSRVYYGSLTIKQPGQHVVKLEVDPQGAIPESDDTNNSLEATAMWQDPPNLRIRSVALQDAAGGGQQTNWKIEIENVGKGAAGEFLTAFMPDIPGASYENLWTASLAAGAVATFSSKQYFRSSGTFSIRAMVDAGWTVPEEEPGGEGERREQPGRQ